MSEMIDIDVARDIFEKKVCFYMAVHSESGTKIARPVEYDQIERGESGGPFLKLDYDKAQSLLDMLLNAGVKPSDGSLSVGEKKALELHLSDMRVIASDRLKVELL